jgi:hypothetical protein
MHNGIKDERERKDDIWGIRKSWVRRRGSEGLRESVERVGVTRWGGGGGGRAALIFFSKSLTLRPQLVGGD